MGRRRVDSDDPQPIGGRQLIAGTVKTIALGKGFGFLAGADGVEYFFHQSQTPDFEAMDRGTPVRFIPGTGPKGPRAESVQLV